MPALSKIRTECRPARLHLGLGLGLGLLCLSACLVGCSSSSDDFGPSEPPPEELTDRSKPAVDTPEAELLSDGKRHFEAGLYSVAKDSFEKLRDGYPLGAYAEFSEIKVADCEFESANYASAAVLYEEFLKNRPASPSTPYALLRAARSNQLSNRGQGRDDASLHRAAELYNQLLTQYPNSPFAEGARGLMQQTQDMLAANEKLVMDFYKRQEQEAAYEARKREFAERFGRDAELVDLEKEPEPLREVVGEAPVGSQVLFEASIGAEYDLANVTAPSKASLDSTSLESGASSATSQDTRTARTRNVRASRSRGNFIRMVECDKAQRLMFLHLQEMIQPPGKIEALNPLRISGSQLTFKVDGITTSSGQPLERDCFANRDVKILSDGTISVETVGSSAQLMELSDPPRILVAFE